MADSPQPKDSSVDTSFSFWKGGQDVIVASQGEPFQWDQSAATVRDHLSDAMNARHVAFLFGSGCSSLLEDGAELGVPTMRPMAKRFLETKGAAGDKTYVTAEERALLKKALGIDLANADFAVNLERLMEVLYSFQIALKRSGSSDLKAAVTTVDDVATKITRYVLKACTEGASSKGATTVGDIYQSFYRKLVYRDRALPQPWVFTINYDLFNELAMDRLGIPYCNGFSGVIERRFNPATFRYSLAEQLDLTNRKWSAVDSFVYLCKLHGSINWTEEATGLFPIRELQEPSPDGRVMIYPTPAKQNISFGSPYSELFREFQNRIVREQSVLFVLGYGFGDEHVNNIIFQALTIPTFRVVAFVSPSASDVVSKLRALNDPRIWIVGGAGPSPGSKAHHFKTFVERFMPERPGDKIDAAIAKVLHTLLVKPEPDVAKDGPHAD